MKTKPAIWFPTVKTNTGSDKFTECLVDELNKKGIRAEITWLPHKAEYLPWLVPAPKVPDWANIVHINSWLHPKFYPKNLPLVVTLHHCVQDSNFSPYKTMPQKLYHYLWITSVEKKALQTANKITTVSQYTANSAKEIFNIAEIEVIYNGIDTNIFYPQKKDKRTHKNQKIKLLFVGSNSKRKGFDLLPQIMTLLGDGYQLYYTSSEDNHLDLPSNMIRLPYQKSTQDLANTYRDMDALIFPSRLEGFGLVVAEAMACGLPVIVANSSALPEIVDHNINGMLCQKDDIHAFVKAINLLAHDHDLYEMISKNAVEKIHQHFQIKTMIDQYIALYQQILN